MTAAGAARTRVALVLVVLVTGCAASPVPPLRRAGTPKQATAPECRAATDCELVARSCCGQCGQPASGDVRAVRAGHAPPRHECEGTGCPRCHADPDPALLAICTSGQCAVLDLHRSPLSRCTTDADCTVRPRGCCDCGATEWVALNTHSDAAYQRRVCGGPTICPECVGDHEGGHRAVCVESHCEIRTARP